MNTDQKLPQELAPSYARYTSLNKAQLYDQIGACNIKICELEHRIPELEDAMRRELVIDDASTSIAIQQSLREHRQELSDLNDQVRGCRRTIIARLELEIERIDKACNEAREVNNVSMIADKFKLECELLNLRKLVE